MSDTDFPVYEKTSVLIKRGLLNSATSVRIRNFFNNPEYDPEIALSVFVDFSPSETGYYLGFLHVSKLFLQFLDRFGRGSKERREFELTGLRIWRFCYGDLLTAYRVFKQNPKQFEELLKSSDEIKAFVAFAAIITE